ncbi:Uncharacterised protein [Bordetella pertussis]|nr:Uncharacterised protein [Bordetella pertussis]CPM59012.1 Uncharacterised protein [Bordetella pertussis]CPO04979.1 Uncharacterised protein [Bordetella pertussis]
MPMRQARTQAVALTASERPTMAIRTGSPDTIRRSAIARLSDNVFAYFILLIAGAYRRAAGPAI